MKAQVLREALKISTPLALVSEVPILYIKASHSGIVHPRVQFPLSYSFQENLAK